MIGFVVVCLRKPVSWVAGRSSAHRCLLCTVILDMIGLLLSRFPHLLDVRWGVGGRARGSSDFNVEFVPEAGNDRYSPS